LKKCFLFLKIFSILKWLLIKRFRFGCFWGRSSVSKRDKEMTRFSLGGDEDGEGPSSRGPKRLRIAVQSNAGDRDYREREGEHCEDGEQETYEEEEEEESDYEEEEEEDEEEEEEGEGEERFFDDEEEDNVEVDPGPTVTVGPRSNGGAQVGRDGSISVTLTDPEVLDCSICYEPLSSPVFQVSSLRPLL